MSEEEQLKKKLVALHEKQQECDDEITKQISSLTTKIESIQGKNATQIRDQEQKNILERSKKKQILYLDNFKVDDPLYTPFYTKYCENTRIIPLFAEPFIVKKYKSKNENIIEVMKDWRKNDITRTINIFYNLDINMFEVEYYFNNGKVKKTEKDIEDIENIEKAAHPNLKNVFTFKDKIYSSDTNNVVEVSTKIKQLLQYFTEYSEIFRSSISNLDIHIEQFINNNTSIKAIKFLSEVTFDIKYNRLIYNEDGSTYTKENTLTHESLNIFFNVFYIKNHIIHFNNYYTLSTFPKPIEYYIKMRIAQTLFSDLPSDFKYDDDKKKPLTDYDSQQVKQLIVNPKNRLIQDELKFSGKVDDKDHEPINAILISSYQDKDELYIVDHELNVYTLVDSTKFVATAAAKAVAAGGKRSRRKRRKISKKKIYRKNIKTISKKKKKIKTRIKKKTRKRSIKIQRR